MGALLLIVLMLALPGSALAAGPSAPALPASGAPLAVLVDAPAPVSSAADAGGFDGYLAGAFTAGAFVGAVVIQVVAIGFLAPALAVAVPPAAIATGGAYLVEAVTAAGGIGGGLLGTWLYARHAPAP